MPDIEQERSVAATAAAVTIAAVVHTGLYDALTFAAAREVLRTFVAAAVVAIAFIAAAVRVVVVTLAFANGAAAHARIIAVAAARRTVGLIEEKHFTPPIKYVNEVLRCVILSVYERNGECVTKRTERRARKQSV